MKKGINIWGFSDDKDLGACVGKAREAGFDGIELAYDLEGPIGPDANGEDMHSIVDIVADEGLEIASLAQALWSMNLISDDAEERKAVEDHIRKGLELAEGLGVDTMLVVPGFTGPFMAGDAVVKDYETCYLRALETFARLGPLAERHGVYIGVENVWNKFLSSPIEMRDFIDRVGHPYVQCYFDVGNVLRNGYPEHWIKVLGSRIRRVHFKDFKANVGTLQGFVDLLTGDVNYPAVMAALKEVGYGGWCTAEIGARTYWPETGLKATAQAMDAIFAG